MQVIGEIRAGIGKAHRRKEHAKAGIYDQWLEDMLSHFAGRIIDFDADCAQVWGALLSGERADPHTIDKQIAAIAIVRNMTLVTRDTGFRAMVAGKVNLLDPFLA